MRQTYFESQIIVYAKCVSPSPLRLCAESAKVTLWFAKILDDFEINDIAALPSLFLL